MRTPPQRGATRFRQALSTAWKELGFICPRCRSNHTGPSSSTVIRPADAPTYSPRSFDVSTVAANSRASRLVVKPRFCVCFWSGVR
jgi:hypothetical protein